MLAMTTPVMLVMPLSQAGWRLALYPAGAFVSWFGSAVFNVAQLTLRQQVCPEQMRGRQVAELSQLYERERTTADQRARDLSEREKQLATLSAAREKSSKPLVMSFNFVPRSTLDRSVPPRLMTRRLKELSVMRPPAQKRLPKTQS